MPSTFAKRVPAMSRVQIREIATNIWKEFGVEGPYFPIIELIENLDRHEVLTMQVKEEQEMGSNLGLTRPKEKIIQLREDVYKGAHNAEPRHRFTVAHEFGHFLLHNKVLEGFARGECPRNRSEDPEWQAECFAGELLIPFGLLPLYSSPEEVAYSCGVSLAAAKVHWKVFLGSRGVP